MTFDDLVARPAFGTPAAAKERDLLPGLNALGLHHYEACEPYRRVVDATFGGRITGERLADLPFLPVSLFKEVELSSTTTPAMVLRSSGTTGQQPSRIVVDADTANRQSKALVSTFQPVLGPSRLPFLVIDTRDVISNPATLTARGAGVLGMMKFGAKAAFVLDGDLEPKLDVVREFLARNGDRPFMIFGFTFLVWLKLFEQFRDGEIDLSNATLIHSGGWKKMEAQKVTNEVFRERMDARFGLKRIFNFYGFVEQIGSIFLEGEEGRLYAPNFTDIIIRDPLTWEPVPDGTPGVIQVVSLLPLSYPGHSLLTEDLGVIEGRDRGVGGRQGKALRVIGRLPKAELRGCSDVIGASVAERAAA